MTTTAELASNSHTAADVIHTPVENYWETYQLAYQLYTLSDRAIPSAYDGLKPVQRRLLYQMYLNKLAPGVKPQKSSKVCSSVSGNLHPHGDASVYGAGALLAAYYQRTRLIDGQGAFPRVQGDVPASSRYTEMRLSQEGFELVKELSEHSVEMVPTFDGEMLEPRILPSRFPVLLVNGAVGIAEGYSTKVPAHNPREVIALCRAMLADPKMDVDAIAAILTGPDWGSGGKVIGSEGIRDYIETGRGKMTVRGEARIEGKDILISALPPGLSSQGFQDKVREGISKGDLPGVSDLTDLTDRRNGLKIVVSVKRGHDPKDVLNGLYTYTPLEDTFAASIVALDLDRVPKWWSVPELITSFLELRDSVVLRRSEHRLEKATARAHLIRGLISVQADIDAAVAIIRKSENADSARSGLMQHFEVDETQADYVLSMQLRRLTSQDVLELQKEFEALTTEIAQLEKLVSSRASRKKVIDKDLVEMEKLFAAPAYDRLTHVDTEAAPSVRAEDEAGGVSDKWCLNEHGVFGAEGTPLKEGMGWAAFTDGRVKVTDGKNLPKPGRDVPVAPDISALLCSGVAREGEDLILVSRKGKMLRLKLSDVNPQGVAGNGIAGIKLSGDDDAVISAFPVTDESALLSISEKAYKVTAVSDVPVKGRGGQGVGFHLFVKGEDFLLEAHESRTGFTVSGKKVSPSLRSKSTTKSKTVVDWARGG
ncbi:MAG: topoisomerase IV [Spirochaetes bacterium]|nr:MAG: topoisomerase IV [Spirochaetota bacterium]